MQKRETNCKKCEERGDQVNTFHATHDINDTPVWECSLCWDQTPRQTRKSQKAKDFEALLAELGLTA